MHDVNLLETSTQVELERRASRARVPSRASARSPSHVGLIDVVRMPAPTRRRPPPAAPAATVAGDSPRAIPRHYSVICIADYSKFRSKSSKYEPLSDYCLTNPRWHASLTHYPLLGGPRHHPDAPYPLLALYGDDFRLDFCAREDAAVRNRGCGVANAAARTSQVAGREALAYRCGPTS